MKRLMYLAVLSMAMMIVSAPAALAHSGPHTYTANLTTLNGSGASGTATVTVEGNQATVETQSQGLVPGKPHAQHIHIGGQNVCPPPSADSNGNGLVSVAEGKPFYGPIEVSLTTTGDVSTESGMAAERFPVADADGSLDYSRTFTLPSDVSPEQIANGVIVQHGINAEGQFQGTIPADCGKLVEQTGADMTDLPDTGGVPLTALALGGSMLLMGGGLLLKRRLS